MKYLLIIFLFSCSVTKHYEPYPVIDCKYVGHGKYIYDIEWLQVKKWGAFTIEKLDTVSIYTKGRGLGKGHCSDTIFLGPKVITMIKQKVTPINQTP